MPLAMARVAEVTRPAAPRNRAAAPSGGEGRPPPSLRLPPPPPPSSGQARPAGSLGAVEKEFERVARSLPWPAARPQLAAALLTERRSRDTLPGVPMLLPTLVRPRGGMPVAEAVVGRPRGPAAAPLGVVAAEGGRGSRLASSERAESCTASTSAADGGAAGAVVVVGGLSGLVGMLGWSLLGAAWEACGDCCFLRGPEGVGGVRRITLAPLCLLPGKGSSPAWCRPLRQGVQVPGECPGLGLG